MGNRVRIVLSLFVLALFSVVAASSAQADEIFNLTLTANSPQPAQYGGTGILTLSQVPGSSGNTTYTTSGTPSLTLSLTIDGVTFSGSGCTAQYTNAVLNTIFGCSFAGVSGDSLTNVYASGTNGGYQATFPGATNGGSVNGIFTIGPGVVSSPEPSSLLMLGIGLLSMMGMAYGRKRLA